MNPIAHFWSVGDATSHGVAILLLIMSVLSWTQIVLKSWRCWRRGRMEKAMVQFWKADSLEEAVSSLEQYAQVDEFVTLARHGMNAAKHFDVRKGAGIDSREEFITRALRQSIVRSTAKLEAGLTLLASVGSIAPFVGLFGTVWGIYHALLGIASAGSASIDKIAGPVGEALIMTAAGLFVAIPEVLAYNAFVRLNRVELIELDGFAHDVHAYLNTGARLKL